ncbi:MAG: beta-lactamase family protein [Chitinophagaceae bacterium]|nr:beta-lactamase family protein [Chitinophagaceae bacterium]
MPQLTLQNGFMYKRFSFFLLFLLLTSSVSAQKGKIRVMVDSLRIAGNFPGLSVALVAKDNTIISLTSGYNNKEKGTSLRSTDRMLQGSVGKTYVAAIALQLIKEGKISLDEKVSAYLGHYDWYKRIPNAESITIRMIMNHTSGVMRYEFKEQFTKDLTADPAKIWTPEDLLRYILDEKASFAAGEGWEYSDTNYILLGMIMEKVTGMKYYDLLQSRVLQPFQLLNTFPSDSRKLPGLAQGYAGAKNEFGGKDKMIGEDGLFIINPQFEWTGGGVYSTTEDLARWGKQLYEQNVLDSAMLKLMLDNAVPAKLGRDVKYGLGVIVRQTSMGTAYGHSGFFPGYMTEMLYFPDHKMCVAVQINSSDFKTIRGSVLRCLLEIARIVVS